MKFKYGKYIFLYVMILTVFVIGITGCKSQQKEDSIKYKKTTINKADSDIKTFENILNDTYNDFNEKKNVTYLDFIKNIVEKFGKKGYIAVDSENQVNMTNYKDLVDYCENVKAKNNKNKKISLFVINYGSAYDTLFLDKTINKDSDYNIDMSFVRYNFATSKGKVKVDKYLYEFKEKELKKTFMVSYDADTWKYTEEGYLFFSGHWESDMYYAYALSDQNEYNAFRVLPLDNECKEYNRKYILPMGYDRNNMFITNWSNKDYGKVDFYDLYDIFSKWANNGIDSDEYAIEKTYFIPSEKFEENIMKYIDISIKDLRSKTYYSKKENGYRYRVRGYIDSENPSVPYPEVVNYKKKNNGIIELMVNAVYPEKSSSNYFTHKVSVKKEDEDNYKYVSNQLVTSDDKLDISWHVDRMTDKEWEETYEEDGE